MACKGIELAVGQIWLDNQGCKITIVENNFNSTLYPWWGKTNDGSRRSYTKEGYYYTEVDLHFRNLQKNVFNPDQRHTVEEVLSANAETFNATIVDMDRVASKVKETLRKRKDPEYAKYLELKAKFET